MLLTTACSIRLDSRRAMDGTSVRDETWWRSATIPQNACAGLTPLPPASLFSADALLVAALLLSWLRHSGGKYTTILAPCFIYSAAPAREQLWRRSLPGAAAAAASKRRPRGGFLPASAPTLRGARRKRAIARNITFSTAPHAKYATKTPAATHMQRRLPALAGETLHLHMAQATAAWRCAGANICGTLVGRTLRGRKTAKAV